MQKGKVPEHFPFFVGAGDESRTRDLNLGKVALYQLSYSRDKSGGASRSRTDLHGFAIRCITALLSRPTATFLQVSQNKKARRLFHKNWSGRRVSNSRPQPWQGCALPTELLPREASAHYIAWRREVKPSAHKRRASDFPKGAAMPFASSTPSTRASVLRQPPSTRFPRNECRVRRPERDRATAESIPSAPWS